MKNVKQFNITIEATFSEDEAGVKYNIKPQFTNKERFDQLEEIICKQLFGNVKQSVQQTNMEIQHVLSQPNGSDD